MGKYKLLLTPSIYSWDRAEFDRAGNPWYRLASSEDLTDKGRLPL